MTAHTATRTATLAADASRIVKEFAPDAHIDGFEDAVANQPECGEWRFQGGLGFGGKIYWHETHGFHVNQYLEDQTEQSLKLCKKINYWLAWMWSEPRPKEPRLKEEDKDGAISPLQCNQQT